MEKEGDHYVVTAFVRNSLDQPIRFDHMPLLFIGPDGKWLEEKYFQ